ncbi:MAG: cyclase family protein [Dehalococcoidales bacterium]
MATKKAASLKWGEASPTSWIDISIPFRDKMVHWPSDPVPRVERIKDRDKGDPVTLTEIQIIDHVGTHIDAPLHFIAGGATIDKMPLNATVGRARVIEIKDTESIKLAELLPYNIRRGERILFKTLNSERCYQTDEFIEDYVYFATEVAQHLVDRGVRAVGLDYLSIGTYGSRDSIHDTHQILLENGVYIIEGINLSGVKPGRYELICLPILLEKGDAAPARAILKPI